LDGSGTVANGLTIYGGGSTVQGLAINNFSSYGLTLSTVGGNTIEANQVSGILISSSGNNINGNTITNSTGDGISITTGADDNQIGVSSSNNIYENAGYGISIVSANGNQITNNNIDANSSGGISISNSTGSIIGNNITENMGDGSSDKLDVIV